MTRWTWRAISDITTSLPELIRTLNRKLSELAGTLLTLITSVTSTQFNVLDYGAVRNTGVRWNLAGDPVAANAIDSTDAFNAAVADALLAGGVVVVPPGQYYLNGQCLGTYTGHLVNVAILGYGAELFAGPAVTGAALKILGGPIPHGICVRGLKFNHRNNTTSSAAIEFSGHSHGVIEDITLEMHNVQAGYAGIRLSLSDPTDDNTACFWTTIRKFRIRERSGGDGTVAQHGILLEGVHNATAIEGGSFTSCVNGISFTSNGVNTNLANGCVIQSNFFEGVTTAVNVVADPTGYWPFGLRVFANRIEATTTFFSMTKSSAGAVFDTSIPPFLFANVCTPASVTNWIVNPANGWISSIEPTAGGIGAPIRIQCKDSSFRMVFTGVQNNLLLANESGFSNYNSAHLQMGEAPYEAHIWVNTGTGDLYYKWGSPPTSATDGNLFSFSGGQTFTVAGTGPGIRWHNTSAAVDEGWWDIGATATALKMRVLDDALAVALNVFQVVRGVGATVDRLELACKLAILTDATYDIGSGAARFRNLYLSGRSSSGQITPSEAVLVSGANASTGNSAVVTLTAARVVGALTSPVTGQRFVFTFIQDATGGRNVTWNAVFKVSWSDAGNTAGKRSSVAFIYDGTNWNQDGAQTPYI